MPYLKITCPPQASPAEYAAIAVALTEAVADLFFNPRARGTREELRERTTVHFAPYADGELYIGGRTPTQRGGPDVTAELSDWYMSVGQQRTVAAGLTPVLARLLGVGDAGLDAVNIRFHSYAPTQFAVGGKLLADRIPAVGRWMKRVMG